MRNIKYIVVHCTATPASTTVESIQNYWRNELGWKNPGYHKIIKPSGEIIQLAPDEKVCNGVAGYNSEALHVSYIGGVDKQKKALDTRTPLQHKALRQVVKNWKEKYPEALVLGHRDFPKVNKDCPSFDARKWWALVGLMLLFLITSCAASKSTTKTETEVEVKEKATVKVKTKENRQTETVTYGDTLKSQSFIPAAGTHPEPVIMESGGLKVRMYFRPIFDDRSLLLGYQVQTQALAKPTAKTTEKFNTTTDTNTQKSTQTEATLTEKKKETKGSKKTWLLLGAGLALLLLLLLAVLIWWLKRKAKIIF